MEEITIKVPEGIKDYKISNWPEFAQQFNSNHKKYILDKQLPGCGATTYYLENSEPLILCSHRSLLLTTKANSPRHIGKVHLFKQPDDSTQEELEKNLQHLHFYIDNCLGSNPFNPSRVPKILVTIDSLPHVFDVLRERGEIQNYTLVSDECQCLITDAPFKEESLLEYTQYLNYVNRVIYLSATPLNNYLAQIPPEYSDIGQLPYYKLEWPEDAIEELHVKSWKVSSLMPVVKNIIESYRENGFFIQNYYHKATQAVFFVNSVRFIRDIIINNKLNPDDCNIICANNKKNLSTLNNNGGRAKLTIGTAPKEGEPHKTFTFVTKCSFEGVDFYHTNAMTFIFANPNIDNLLVDIYNEIPQIIGRQRLKENPWKNWAFIYTLAPNTNIPTQAEFTELLNNKDEMTQTKIREFNNNSDYGKKVKIEENKILKSKIGHGYKNDYLQFVTEPQTHEVMAIPNFLVRLCELRAWDIRSGEYINNLQSFSKSYSNPVIEKLEENMQKSGPFQSKMSVYLYFRATYPLLASDFESSALIDICYHEYYNKLGADKIRALSCQESLLEKAVSYVNASPNIAVVVYQSFMPGRTVSNKEAKDTLQKIYDNLGITKTAKATDLKNYFNVEETNITKDGKRVHGIKIVSAK